MTLRTVPVPTPDAGFDWATVVPGQYLYDVTGITATLDTGAAGMLCADASGNSNHGVYSGAAGLPTFVPSLIAGADLAADFTPPAFPFGATHHVNLPTSVFEPSGPFSIELWLERTDALPGGGVGAILGGLDSATLTDFRFVGFGGGGLSVNQNFPGADYEVFADPFVDMAPHHLVFTWDGVTGAFYIDGANVPLDSAFGAFGPVDFSSLQVAGNANIGFADAIFDEYAIYPAALSAGQVAAHYAAGAVSFAVYTAAVLADAPVAYYHLDGAGDGGARQPVLIVTLPTGTVEAIPTGFALASGAGPYDYSWQPRLPASTQTPSGDLTTVAIPRLLLPAGYSVGTYTPDLVASDQWSDITLWWDDAAMNAAAASYQFVYPPGAYLHIVTRG